LDTLPGNPPFVDNTLDRSNRPRFAGEARAPTEVDYAALATFRYLIRRFLATSEGIARTRGLNPQQHQCLLAIAGRPNDFPPTVGYLASRLLIEHHSAVGLVDRLVGQGLVERRPSEEDRRQVEVHLTKNGAALLERLAHAHRDELRVLAPRLVRSLEDVVGL
jgi:DNA-binding MarR family transcriptional regulator